MNPKASFVVHTLRFAGLFNLPIPLRCTFGIGVSTMKTKEMTFKELGIDKRILKAITELGFETPMPVQQEVIPFLLNQTKDLVAMAHTGTGKTAAFGIPIIQQIDFTSIKTQALILAPTRELCMQITDDLSNFAKHIENLNIVAIYGGASIMTQIRQVASGAQIIVATPGRMLDMLKRKKVNVSAIRWLVLDEADEMLNMGFKEELSAVLASTPEDKRVLLFSATMPRGIESIARSYMKKPEEITVGSQYDSGKRPPSVLCGARQRQIYSAQENC